MAKTTSQKPSKAPLPYEDEVLPRMLSTPPKPHKAKPEPQRKAAKTSANSGQRKQKP